MLSFEHVSKFILSDITLHIPRGVCVGIIGASGAGKTTFLKLACGLLAPTKGTVYTLQKDSIEKRTEICPRIGCLLERIPILEEYETVEENFRKLQIIHRIPEEKFRTEYAFLKERFGMREYEHVAVKSLSLGQRRRAELAAVLLHRPELLLLDEPVNGLDENAKQILKEILQERVCQGMTLVLTSHNMREVAGICERIVVLEQGKLLYYGEQATLLKEYAPMDRMCLKLTGELPDMEDLPLEEYCFEEDRLVLTYNSNYVTAAEIMEVLLPQTSIGEVSIQKQELSEVIFAIKAEEYRKTSEEKKGESNELH